MLVTSAAAWPRLSATGSGDVSRATSMLGSSLRRGFANPTSSTCHFAALLQGLFSSSSFVHAVRAHGACDDESACAACLLRRSEAETRDHASSQENDGSGVSVEPWKALLESPSWGFSFAEQHDPTEVFQRLTAALPPEIRGCCEISTGMRNETRYVCGCHANTTSEHVVNTTQLLLYLCDGVTSIADLLRNACQPEERHEDVGPRCIHCFAQGYFHEQRTIMSTSRTLVVLLNRTVAAGNVKSRCDITPSPRLEVNATRYRLTAVLVHRGRHGGGGHCVTYVRAQQQWWCYDDERRLARINLPREARQDGFAFFYQVEEDSPSQLAGSSLPRDAPLSSRAEAAAISISASLPTPRACEPSSPLHSASVPFVPDFCSTASPATSADDVEMPDAPCWDALDSEPLAAGVPPPRFAGAEATVAARADACWEAMPLSAPDHTALSSVAASSPASATSVPAWADPAPLAAPTHACEAARRAERSRARGQADDGSRRRGSGRPLEQLSVCRSFAAKATGPAAVGALPTTATAPQAEPKREPRDQCMSLLTSIPEAAEENARRADDGTTARVHASRIPVAASRIRPPLRRRCLCLLPTRAGLYLPSFWALRAMRAPALR